MATFTVKFLVLLTSPSLAVQRYTPSCSDVTGRMVRVATKTDTLRDLNVMSVELSLVRVRPLKMKLKSCKGCAVAVHDTVRVPHPSMFTTSGG